MLVKYCDICKKRIDLATETTILLNKEYHFCKECAKIIEDRIHIETEKVRRHTFNDHSYDNL